MSILYVIALLSLRVAIISSAPIDFENEQPTEPLPTEQGLAKSEYVQNYANEHLLYNNGAPTETPTETENLENLHLGNTNVENEASTTSDIDDFEDVNEPNLHSQVRDEILEPAQARYIPYFRFRRIYYNNRKYGNRYPAMVGYADSRDRFPTVA